MVFTGHDIYQFGSTPWPQRTEISSGREPVLHRRSESDFPSQGGNYCNCPPPPPPGPGVATSEWIMWPQIHGTPVFGAFPDGRAFLYLWAEKDFLRASDSTRRPPRFASTCCQSRESRPTSSGDAVLAPPYLSDQILANGMPGGMLSLTIDPAQPAAACYWHPCSAAKRSASKRLRSMNARCSGASPRPIARNHALGCCVLLIQSR
jgi:hypothetical protein